MAEKTKSQLKKKRKGIGFFNEGAVDLYFLCLIFILLAIGLLMLFSASYPYALYNRRGDGLYFLKNQLEFAIIGTVVMLFISKIDSDFFKKLTYPMLILTLVLLVVVLLLPARSETPDFKRWLYVPGWAGSPTFQPSELAKIALVMFCALKMEKGYKKLSEKHFGFMPYAIITVVLTLLIVLENHYSGAILLISLGVMMMYLGGAKRYWFIIGIILAVILFVLLLTVPEIFPDRMIERIEPWLNKEAANLTKERWQTNQSLYAISSGGFFGVGLGHSKQKHLYVPEPQNDFIFSIVCEELGLFGASVIIILFALLIARGVTIALKARDRFGSLLVLGVVFHIGIQVAINIGVVTDFLPNTGISLPFFSSGGTALVVLMAELGMVLSVSRTSSLKKV